MDDDARSRRARPGRPARRKLLAVLAGCLVLGVGATWSLAAWTDEENATASFSASTFDTESKGAGDAAYASNDTAPGATLSFTAGVLSPGATAVTWIDLRTSDDTDVAGTAGLTASAPTGALGDAVEYRAVLTTAGTDCADALAAGSPTYVAGSGSTYVASGTVPGTATSIPLAAAGATPQRVCFEIELPADAPSSLQGTTGTVLWTFSTQSVT